MYFLNTLAVLGLPFLMILQSSRGLCSSRWKGPLGYRNRTSLSLASATHSLWRGKPLYFSREKFRGKGKGEKEAQQHERPRKKAPLPSFAHTKVATKRTGNKEGRGRNSAKAGLLTYRSVRCLFVA